MTRSALSVALSSLSRLWKPLTSALTLVVLFSFMRQASADAFASSVVEQLIFQVAPERVGEFIRQDAEVWTRFLAAQEGFISKRVWTSESNPNEVRIIVRWRSRQDWNRVPKKDLQRTEEAFRKAMGGQQNYELVEVNAYDETESNPNQQGLRIISLTGENQEWLSAPQDIVVAYDHVYKKSKRYRAVPLRHVLEVSFNLGQIDQDAAHLVFECADGYQKTMPLSKALAADGWIAVRDLDAREGKQWVKIREKSLAPFYAVWRNLNRAKAADYPWPYALERLRIVEKDEFYEAAYPMHAKEAVAGFYAFRKHCLACHSINGCGGTMGVELNSPRNVTEYWKSEALREFILDPGAFRLHSKMPSMKHLPAEEIDAVLLFLHAIAENKQPTAAHPELDER